MLQTYNPRVPPWARLVTALAAVRVATAFALYLSGQVDTSAHAPIPVWAYFGLSFAFAALGVMLVVANRNDVRAEWLGGALLLIAAPLTGQLLSNARLIIGPWLNDYVRPDALLPAFLWHFVTVFPSPLRGSTASAAKLMASIVTLTGAITAGVNLSLTLWPPGSGDPGMRTLLVAGATPGSVYWLVLFVPCVAAFLAMLVRLAASSGADRIRTQVFIGGLAGGTLPIFVEVVVEGVSPSYRALVHSPAIEPWAGLFLFGALATVPLVTSYSVLFDHVVELRVVLRAALQYLLARYTILAAAVLPSVALGLYLVEHRAESLVALLAGPRPLLLLSGVAASAFALRLRQRWLDVLDRKFFREQYDARLLLTRVMDSDFISQDPAGIASGLADEIDRALHASVDLFVADATRARLVDPRGSGRHLPADSTLVRLAMADSHPMRLDVGPDSVLNRLPASEKAWVTSGRYQLIAGLRTRSGEPAGLLALGEKRSGLGYSDADRQSIGALSGPLTLTIEHHRLRNTTDPPVDRTARECLACSRLHEPDAVDCTCGGVLAQGHAPHILRGTFRFEQRIGSGGMGIVYRAVDMSLGRDVAIKTLPKVTSEHVTRLRREAQAMASLQHPNLAVIYGIETWQGIPFLVEEYLAGGTLTNRISAARLGIGEAIELGITLAGVLETLHGSGIIHCDIKPSNIGYTRAGTPKLLDFGLVHMLRRSGDGNLSSTAAVTSDTPRDVSGSFIATDRGVMGTPPYMSPEAIRAHQPAPPVDLWALSVVLYESIGGRRPFEGVDAQEIFRHVGAGQFPGLQTLRENCRDEVARFFTNAFSPDPSQRPQNAKAFKTALMALRSVET